MPNEDRELQIRLAELQTDIQINLTLCLGIIGILIAGIIAFAEIFFVLTAEQIVQQITAIMFMTILAITMFILERRYIKKVWATRKQLTELRKQYENRK